MPKISALPTINVERNDTVAFGQRPVVEAIQFKNGGNVGLVPQDPDLGNYRGIKLPDLRAAVKKDVMWSDDQAERQWAQDRLLAGQEAALLSQGFGRSTVADFLAAMRTDFASRGVTDLRRELVAVLEDTIHPDGDALVQPQTEFLRRMHAGKIKPPMLDFDALLKEATLDKLFDALPLAYKMAGLPTLSKAFGISDVLAAEEGSKGNYKPGKHEFVDTSVDYNSRASIPLITRIAWNRASKLSLYAQSPYIPANMRCVTDVKSARAAIKNGICPIISYTDTNKRERIAAAAEFGKTAFITARMGNGEGNGELDTSRQILKNGGNLHIEVANANMVRVAERIRLLKREFPTSFISVGNVGSAEGFWLCAEAGADMIKLGRAPGAGCTTAIETGLSPGQVTLAYECAMVQFYLLVFRGIDVAMNLDGGMSTPGHVVVGATLGAESFMFGSLLARAKESPAAVFKDTKDPNAEWIEYFGESSGRAHELDGKEVAAGQQGIAGYLRRLGPLADVVRKLNEGVRGGVADLRNRTFGHLVGSLHPYLLRYVTLASAKETGTRLEAPPTLGRKVTAGRYEPKAERK